MEETEKGENFSVNGGNDAPSTSKNVDSNTNTTKRQQRRPKKCNQCGTSVINLSRHQKDVHGMTKLKRKLDGYFTGEKKTPKRRVKFCPLSPCKSLKTPIFQLHKHLQTSIHNLKPNSPRYLKALADAPRASVASVKSACLKQQRKRAQKRKLKRDKKTQLTNTDGSIYSNEEEMEEEETEENMVGAGEEGVSCREAMESDLKDRDRAETDERVQLERTRNSADSDEEYDKLTSRVWKDYEDRKALNVNDRKGHHTKRIKKDHKDAYINREEAKSQDENDEESASEEENADSDEEYKDLLRRTVKTEDMACTFDEPADNAITVSSSSDRASDLDYICGDEDAHSEESDLTDDSQSSKAENLPSLRNERDGLLTELVEVVGEKNIDGVSFLDEEKEEKAWKKYVKRFKDNRVKEGHRFKTSQEIADELSRVYKEEDTSYDQALQVMFEGDESDDDDEIDTEWVPSDCELDEEETDRTEPEIGTRTLLQRDSSLIFMVG